MKAFQYLLGQKLDAPCGRDPADGEPGRARVGSKLTEQIVINRLQC
jgi:hypothetical protein